MCDVCFVRFTQAWGEFVCIQKEVCVYVWVHVCVCASTCVCVCVCLCVPKCSVSLFVLGDHFIQNVWKQCVRFVEHATSRTSLVASKTCLVRTGRALFGFPCVLTREFVAQ